MWRKPRSAARSSAAPTRGCATPLNAASAQPKPSPSHSMRATLAILALASGSLVPRPTTTSSESATFRRRRDGGDAVGSGFEQVRVDAEIAAEPHLGPRMRGHKAVHLPRQVVLDVARGEQHARYRQYFGRAARPQSGERLADRRAGEFEIAGREIAAARAGRAAPRRPARIPRSPRGRGCRGRTAAPPVRSSSVSPAIDRAD